MLPLVVWFTQGHIPKSRGQCIFLLVWFSLPQSLRFSVLVGFSFLLFLCATGILQGGALELDLPGCSFTLLFRQLIAAAVLFLFFCLAGLLGNSMFNYMGS